MSNAHRLALLLLPTAIFAFGAACDSLKPVELEQQGNDTAAGSNPDEDTGDTPTSGGPGGGGGGPGGGGPGSGTGNTPPRANAGPDQAGVAIGDVAFLDGTGSTDADGDTLTYAWSFDYRVNGSTATISNASSPTATVYLDKPGEYLIKLTVIDAAGDSDDDVVKLTVTAANGAPTANAGIDQSVSLGQLVQLSGLTSSDPNPGDTIAYQWTFASKPGGSVTQLSGDQTATPRFTADVTGVYTVSLTVSDGTLDSAPDLVTINVTDPATSGGTGSGSNSGDCLSCSSEDAARRFAAGDAANGLLIGALPLLALLVERRRRR